MDKYKHPRSFSSHAVPEEQNIAETPQKNSVIAETLCRAQESVQKAVKNIIDMTQHTILPKSKGIFRKSVLGAMAASAIGSAASCTNVPTMVGPTFAVQTSKGKTVQKEACGSRTYFSEVKKGEYVSRPGIALKNKTPKDILGTGYSPTDVELLKDKVFPTKLPDEEAWSMLQDFRKETLKSTQEVPMSYSVAQVFDTLITVRQDLLSTMYPQIQQKYPDTVFDCVEVAPENVYYNMFVEGFAERHGLFANFDDRVVVDKEGIAKKKLELIIGRTESDATFDIESSHLKKTEGTMELALEEQLQQVITVADELMGKHPHLYRIMDMPEHLRVRRITDVQKTTNTSAFFNPAKGIVLYDSPRDVAKWKPAMLFHEMAHVMDHAQKDEAPTGGPTAAEQDVLGGSVQIERMEFIGMVMEAGFVKKKSSKEDRVQWVTANLQESQAKGDYKVFHRALKKFSDRYVQEKFPAPFTTTNLELLTPVSQVPACYGEDEYWDLLEKYLDILMQQLPGEDPTPPKS